MNTARPSMWTLQAIICSMLICLGGLHAQEHLKEHEGDHLKTMDEVKEWSVEVSSGSLTLRLSSYATAGKPADTVLWVHITPVNGLIATRDLIVPIAEVLKRMPKLGYDPARLVMISTPLRESEYNDGVNRAVQQSGVWKRGGCIGDYSCWPAVPVANKYLGSISAYSDLDSVFTAAGLRRVEVVADEMACSKEAGNTTKIGCGGLIRIMTVPVRR